MGVIGQGGGVAGAANGSGPGEGNANQGQAGTGGEGGSGGAGSGAAGGSGASGAGSAASWRDSLPDDLKGNQSLSLIQDIPSLAKAYVHAQSQIGKKGVIVPTPNDGEETWKGFYKQLGLPELEKYEVKGPEGATLNEDLVKGFRENAHKVGILPKQAQGMLDWYLGIQKAQGEASTQAKAQKSQENLAALKKEWGEGYDKNIGVANDVFNEIFGDELGEIFVETGLSTHPTVVKKLVEAAKYLTEDKLRGDGTNRPGGQTPDEIQAEINKLMSDPRYHNRNHTEHKDVVSRMENLFKAKTRVEKMQRGA